MKFPAVRLASVSANGNSGVKLAPDNPILRGVLLKLKKPRHPLFASISSLFESSQTVKIHH